MWLIALIVVKFSQKWYGLLLLYSFKGTVPQSWAGFVHLKVSTLSLKNLFHFEAYYLRNSKLEHSGVIK